MDILATVKNERGDFKGSPATSAVFALTSSASMRLPLPLASLGRRHLTALEEDAAKLAIVQLNLVPGLHLCQNLGFPSAYQATEDETFSSPPTLSPSG